MDRIVSLLHNVIVLFDLLLIRMRQGGLLPIVLDLMVTVFIGLVFHGVALLFEDGCSDIRVERVSRVGFVTGEIGDEGVEAVVDRVPPSVLRLHHGVVSSHRSLRLLHLFDDYG